MFGVLGPLQAPEPLLLGGSSRRRESRILGALLLSANQPVAMSSLVDLLWPTAPPATARQQVQNCVSAIDRRLRRGGLDIVRRLAGGYVAEIECHDLDALRFVAEAQRGRQQAARRDYDAASVAFRRALSTWRGEVLAGLELGPFEPVALQLSELRLSTREAFYDCEIRAGRQAEVVAGLQMHVHQYPTRERLVGQLMQALAAVGRTSEALEQFHRTRQLLSRDYGIDVSPELAATFRSILRQEMADAASSESAAPADDLCRAWDHVWRALGHIEEALRRVRSTRGVLP